MSGRDESGRFTAGKGIIHGTVIGVEAVTTKFRVLWPAEIRQRVSAAVRALGFEFETIVKTVKLNGGVLNRRSGRLARSINTRFTETPTSITSTTGTSVSYGKIWELTGSREFTILPKDKQALFWPGAAHPVRSVLHPAQQPRPFLRPTLEEMRPTIRATIDAALRSIAQGSR